MIVDHSRGRSSDKIRQAAAKQSGRTLLGQGREGRESSASFYPPPVYTLSGPRQAVCGSREGQSIISKFQILSETFQLMDLGKSLFLSNDVDGERGRCYHDCCQASQTS